jgi:hypothetical protein
MDTTLAAILGVVAGALTTTGAQLWITSRQRRNDALAAARVTWGALSDALAALEGTIEEGAWVIGAIGMERDLALWEEHRLAVARSVDGLGFRTLEVAFLRLRQTLEQAGSFDQAGLKAVLEDRRLAEDLRYLQEARKVALHAGLTRLERVRDPRKTKRLHARMSAATAVDATRVVADGESAG